MPRMVRVLVEELTRYENAAVKVGLRQEEVAKSRAWLAKQPEGTQKRVAKEAEKLAGGMQ